MTPEERRNKKANIISYIMDVIHGKAKKYGNEDKKKQNEIIRKKLIECNDGAIPHSFRDINKKSLAFEIIEEVITITSREGLSENDFYNNYVEEKTVGYGDICSFKIKREWDYVMAEASRGLREVRRQRINMGETLTLTPKIHEITVYDEYIRVLSGQTTISEMIEAVTKAKKNAIFQDIYTAFLGVGSKDLGTRFAPVAGTYSEDALLDLVTAVQAANNGGNVVILATLKGARKIRATDGSETGKQNIYDYGYELKWNGIPVEIIPQKFKAGTDEFLFDDNMIYVMPLLGEKPIKVCHFGSDYLRVGEPTDNHDMTIDTTLISLWNIAVLVGREWGIYKMT